MATTRMKARERACKKQLENGRVNREKLRAVIKDQNVDYDEKLAAVIKLNKRPRDESYVRWRRRCAVCGRSRGVYRKFKLCRCCLREAVMFGLVPGVRKASW